MQNHIQRRCHNASFHRFYVQHYNIHFHEAKRKNSRTCARPRTKLWPQGQLGLKDLTSLLFAETIYTLASYLVRG